MTHQNICRTCTHAHVKISWKPYVLNPSRPYSFRVIYPCHLYLKHSLLFNRFNSLNVNIEQYRKFSDRLSGQYPTNKYLIKGNFFESYLAAKFSVHYFNPKEIIVNFWYWHNCISFSELRWKIEYIFIVSKNVRGLSSLIFLLKVIFCMKLHVINSLNFQRVFFLYIIHLMLYLIKNYLN